MKGCVSINIISENTILNKNGLPILFYWDGKSNIKTGILQDESFLEFLQANVFTKERYATSVISYVSFVEEADDEVYKSNVVKVQDCYKLADISYANIVKDYYIEIFTNLYKKAFNRDYENVVDNYETLVKSIYDEIKAKYGDKITPVTICEYTRSQIRTMNTLLSEANINFIIDNLNNIINQK